MHRRRLRGLVRDYILDAIEENPEANREEIEREASSRLKEDFGETNWLEILLKFLQLLLPFLLALKRNRSDK